MFGINVLVLECCFVHLSLIDTCSPRQETILPKKSVSGRLTTARGSAFLLWLLLYYLSLLYYSSSQTETELVFFFSAEALLGVLEGGGKKIVSLRLSNSGLQ